MNSKTNLIIVAAPSGAGKSTFCEKIKQDLSNIIDTVSYTTRSPRVGDKHGETYYFVSEKEFLDLKSQDFFTETAEVHGKHYGTPRYQLKEAWDKNLWVIMDVDVQGADSIKKIYPNAKLIFVLPPSYDELRRRIVKRDKGQTLNLDLRLKNAKLEIDRSHEFDYRIVNDDFDKAYSEFKKIIEDLMQKS